LWTSAWMRALRPPTLTRSLTAMTDIPVANFLRPVNANNLR